MNPESLLHPVVGVYLALVLLSQLLLAGWRRHRDRVQEARRRSQGLDHEMLVHTQTRLASLRRRAIVESTLLVVAVFGSPFLLAALMAHDADAKKGLAMHFGALFVWLLMTGSDIGKAFLGGLGFRSLVAFNRPFQVGDRVTIGGHVGKVESLGIFHVSLQTPNDDRVSIPTGSLWNQTVVSANAGDRASLCVMSFYIAPFASSKQLDDAENALWDAVQASSYFAFTRPLQIFVAQSASAIVLTAKAYVANTYDEPLFVSDVTRLFLKQATLLDLPLASERWRESRERSDAGSDADTGADAYVDAKADIAPASDAAFGPG